MFERLLMWDHSHSKCWNTQCIQEAALNPKIPASEISLKMPSLCPHSSEKLSICVLFFLPLLGYYMLFDGSSPRKQNDIAEFYSPMLNTSDLCIRYKYTLYGSGFDLLSAIVRDPVSGMEANFRSVRWVFSWDTLLYHHMNSLKIVILLCFILWKN